MMDGKIEKFTIRRNVAITLLLLMLSPQLFSQDEKDTVKYTLAPVLVTATEAKERETPVTFTRCKIRMVVSHLIVNTLATIGCAIRIMN